MNRTNARPANKAAAVYTLQARFTRGPVSPAFIARNPVVARTVVFRGDHTLDSLHHALAAAFGRTDALTYEFRPAADRRDGAAAKYVAPMALAAGLHQPGDGAASAADVRLDVLGLKPGARLVYLVDDGEEWWFEIAVQSAGVGPARGRYPRVTQQMGDAPRRDGHDDDVETLTDSAADAACLIGELHLRQGDYARAVEAFTRAVESRPTADAFEGRSRAYRALADGDRVRAGELRGP